MMVKCDNCKTELFKTDVVETVMYFGFMVPTEFPSVYRCPKCFKTKKINIV